MNSMRLFSIATLLLTGSAFAHDLQWAGTMVQPLQRPTNLELASPNAQARPTSVTLLKVELSDNAWKKIQARTLSAEAQPNATHHFGMGKNVQLGMNNVPVLNQGAHGTCVTFANTAAIDAALNQGDVISQLCQLQLGRHLENNGYSMSGWNGSSGAQVLHQMKTFGVVSKAHQLEHGCGGLTEYPASSSVDPETEISLADYHAISEELSDNYLRWSALLDPDQFFADKVDAEKTLQATKSALNKGNRLTFGVLLFGLDQGVVGAAGKYHVSNDTWVLSDEVIRDIKNQGEPGGHEMIITGYNDDAVAIDKHGRTHKGLLTLRNSWGSNVADKGDFYMSYDYFKTLTIELQQIRGFKTA